MHPDCITDSAFQQRFSAHLTRCASGCLEWHGHKNKSGYGSITIAGHRTINAHRLAWMLTRGPIPEGMCVCHTCDNRLCCELSHLWLGTKADNARDMMIKGRNQKFPVRHGEQIESAKLTAAQVQEIRTIYQPGSAEYGQASLARRFHVHETCISKVIRRETWAGI